MQIQASSIFFYIQKGEYMGVKKLILLIILVLGMSLCSCCNREKQQENIEKQKIEILEELYEKGYDLPIKESDQREAEEECIAAIKRTEDIYVETGSGNSDHVVLNDSAMEQMKKEISKTKNPVISSEKYSVMENYQVMEKFLHNAEQRKKGEVVLYNIFQDGSIERNKYLYDGEEMYLLVTRAIRDDIGNPMIMYNTYTKINQWRYTEKGWFEYELCVPEPPEVTEIVDGSCLIRVRPLEEKCIELSKKCVLPLGYKGNNLLCSNWDINNLEDLDYNGMYEFLYQMKYGKKFIMQEGKTGIPAQEFEQLIMNYIPVTAGQIQKMAVFDSEKQEYKWQKLGCGNYLPTYFGASLPEVVEVKKNTDGTLKLTVQAVCDRVILNDAVITHELTVKFKEDGSFIYLGNHILNDGIHNIPEYQYRVSK